LSSLAEARRKSGSEDDKGISLSIDLTTVPPLECTPQQVAALCQHDYIAVAQLLVETRGTFDIGKEKGNVPRGKIKHGNLLAFLSVQA
jgi:hypothetical protein